MRHALPAAAELAAARKWGGVRKVAAPAPPDTLHLSCAEYEPAARFFSYCFDESRPPASAGRAASLWAAGRFRPLPRQDLLQAGAHGFVDKSSEASVLLDAIRAVRAG